MELDSFRFELSAYIIVFGKNGLCGTILTFFLMLPNRTLNNKFLLLLLVLLLKKLIKTRKSKKKKKMGIPL